MKGENELAPPGRTGEGGLHHFRPSFLELDDVKGESEPGRGTLLAPPGMGVVQGMGGLHHPYTTLYPRFLS